MSEANPISEPSGEVVVYEAPDGGARVEVVIGVDTVWLTQRQMADLFESTVLSINEHIKNAYGEGEISEGATVREFRIVRSEGRRQIRRRIQHRSEEHTSELQSRQYLVCR